MFFTEDDFKKIETWLHSRVIKDTEFEEIATPLEGYELMTLVQDNMNKKMMVKDFITQVFGLGESDYVNVTDKYKESYITIEQAIRLIPCTARKIGQTITFINEKGNWKVYQFRGESLNQWCHIPLWVDTLDRIATEDTPGLVMGGYDTEGKKYIFPVLIDEDGRMYIDITTIQDYIFEDNIADAENAGAIRLGFPHVNGKFPVELDERDRAFVEVPIAKADDLGTIQVGYERENNFFPIRVTGTGDAYAVLELVTHEEDGLMSKGDKIKFDRIETANFEIVNITRDTTKNYINTTKTDISTGEAVTKATEIESATSSLAGLMSAQDKTEHDRINTANYDLGEISRDANNVTINATRTNINTGSSENDSTVIPSATKTQAGIMSAEDKTTLDRLDDNIGDVNNLTTDAKVIVDAINEVDNHTDANTESINKIKGDITNIQGDINDINQEINDINQDISDIENSINDINGIPEGGSTGQVLKRTASGGVEWANDNDTIYSLPIASSSVLGGVKIGSGINRADDGTISVDTSGGGGTSYVLPPATTSTLGGVKVGSGLSVTEDGTLSTTGGGGGGTIDWNDIQNRPKMLVLETIIREAQNSTFWLAGTWQDGGHGTTLRTYSFNSGAFSRYDYLQVITSGAVNAAAPEKGSAEKAQVLNNGVFWCTPAELTNGNLASGANKSNTFCIVNDGTGTPKIAVCGYLEEILCYKQY